MEEPVNILTAGTEDPDARMIAEPRKTKATDVGSATGRKVPPYNRGVPCRYPIIITSAVIATLSAIKDAAFLYGCFIRVGRQSNKIPEDATINIIAVTGDICPI